jgi:PqqD family protein of HPr-rel-A system
MDAAERLSNLAVNHDGFVFDPSTGDSYVLNQTGLVVLEGLQDGIDEVQIAREVAERFEVTEEAAQRDITDFVSRLKTLQLM